MTFISLEVHVNTRTTRIPLVTYHYTTKGVIGTGSVDRVFGSGVVQAAQTLISSEISTSFSNWKWRIGHGEILAANYYRQDPPEIELNLPGVYTSNYVLYMNKDGSSLLWNDFVDVYNGHNPFGSVPAVSAPPSAKTLNAGNSLVNAAFAEVNASALALVDVAEGHKTISMLALRVSNVRSMFRTVIKKHDDFLRKREKLKLSGNRQFRSLKFKRKGAVQNEFVDEFRYEPLGAFSFAALPRSKQRSLRRVYKKKGITADFSPDSLWLEIQYGWKPAIMSCEDYLGEYGRWLSNVKRHRIIKKEDQTTSCTSRSFIQTSFDSATGFDVVTSTRSNVARAQCTVIFEVLNSAARAGLSLNALPLTAWELVPYSFVLDWFVNIGDVLAAATPSPHIRPLMSCISTTVANNVYKYTYKYAYLSQRKSVDGNGGFSLIKRGGYGEASKVVKNGVEKGRAVGVSPSWTLNINLDVSSLTHLISGTALSFQTLSRLRR